MQASLSELTFDHTLSDGIYERSLLSPVSVLEAHCAKTFNSSVSSSNKSRTAEASFKRRKQI